MTQDVNSYAHAPSASLDYSINWSEWLRDGETIVSSTWTATEGVTLSNATNIAGVTSTFVTGGTINNIYILTNFIVTSAGRADNRVIILSCKRR